MFESRIVFGEQSGTSLVCVALPLRQGILCCPDEAFSCFLELLNLPFLLIIKHTDVFILYRMCARPPRSQIMFPHCLLQKPLLFPVTQDVLNLFQYVNTVMQLLCKEICEEKALPEWRDYPAGGLKG